MEWWGAKSASTVRLSLTTKANCSSQRRASTTHFNTSQTVHSVFKKRSTHLLCCHVTSVCHKNSLWLFRNISRRGFRHPKASSHTNANTNACVHKHRHTHAPNDPAGFGSHALTSGSQSKGCCSAAYNGTTDPPCSSCKFCSFSSGAQKSAMLFCERRRRRREEWRGKRTEEWSHCLCVRAKSLCLHEGWDCACVSPCVCMRAWCVTLYSTCAYKKSREQGTYSFRWKHSPMLQA